MGAIAHLAARGIAYRCETRTDPRPLVIHIVQVPLGTRDLRVRGVVTADPDDAGPAEATLASPLALAEAAGALVLVNANAFGALPNEDGSTPPHWFPGQPVTVLSLAAADGTLRSPPEPPYTGFWIDRDGTPHCGLPADPATVRDGVAGFNRLLRDGKVVPRPGGPTHPRTMVGFDADRTTLTLVVVDGRQEGVSEGMTSREQAALLRELGCAEGVNLDGGGSSVLVAADGAGGYVVLNRPSTRVMGVSAPRPAPAALAVSPN